VSKRRAWVRAPVDHSPPAALTEAGGVFILAVISPPGIGTGWLLGAILSSCDAQRQPGFRVREYPHEWACKE